MNDAKQSEGRQELAACPFCGSNECVAAEEHLKSWSVICIDCDTSGPVAESEAEAEERWNHQIKSAQLGEAKKENERLRESFKTISKEKEDIRSHWQSAQEKLRAMEEDFRTIHSLCDKSKDWNNAALIQTICEENLKPGNSHPNTLAAEALEWVEKYGPRVRLYGEFNEDLITSLRSILAKLSKESELRALVQQEEKK